MRVAPPLLSLVAVGAFAGTDYFASPRAASDAADFRRGAAPLRSAGQLAFGPGGVLFVADARGAAIYAIDVGEGAAKGGAKRSGNWQVPDVDRRIAAALGASTDDLRFNDMATHPTSGNAYLSLTRGRGEGATPVLVRVTTGGDVTPLDLADVRFSSAPIPSSPAPSDTNRWGQPLWMMSVTDLAFADGKVWIAGLSNEQFASSLRRITYPFTERGSELATLEVYHTSHDKYETQSPVTAFLPVTLGGKSLLVAGYGCAPVAVFDRAALDGGKHVRGRTVAELGGGNAPLDFVPYRKDGRDFLLVSNSDRTLMRFDTDSLVAGPAMTTSVKTAYQPAGVPYLPLAEVGVMQLAPYDEESLAVLRRDIESGRVTLASLRLWF